MMTITLGFATQIALAVAIGLPILVSLLVWSVQWLRICKFLYWSKQASGEKRDLPPALIQVLFDGQYYSFLLLQPLRWALPWVLVMLFFGLPAGVLLDNGFVIQWFTLGMAVLVFAGGALYIMRFANEFTLRNPPWWLQTPAVLTMVMVALLIGVALDNWFV